MFAIDGSDLHIPTNKDDPDSYFSRVNDQRPYNLLHLNALFDICEKTYIDAIIQKSRISNKNLALIDMVDRISSEKPAIIIADRGYESYNALAHIQEKGWKFLFHIKAPASKGGIACCLDIPQTDEFDELVDLHLTAGRTKEHWEMYNSKNKYRRISHPESFDYFMTDDGTVDIYKIYTLSFASLNLNWKTTFTKLSLQIFHQKHFPKTILNSCIHSVGH
ncbi:transposase [Lacrimispora sp.]|uniref:transposase n=1 Tax=Lacrimispora sp. TaxID=2719234 RepID=UPI0034605EAA